MTGDSLLDGTWRDDVLRVVVCDDHALMRRRLVVTLEADPDIAVVAEAIDSQHVVEVARRATPDCVVLGLKVEPGGALAAARELRAVAPGARLVVVVSTNDEAEAVQAVMAGVTGIITRESLEQTVAVVRAVASGVVAVPPLVARLLIDEMARITAEGPGLGITERERAVLEHLAAGHSYATAATALRMPDHTAKNLAANAIEKLVRHQLGAAET